MLFCRPIIPLRIDELQSLEERGEWGAAADRLQLVRDEASREDSASIASIEGTIAYFLLRSGLQAENQPDFDKKVSQAVVLLKSAAEHYSKSRQADSRISATACKARAEFLLGWTSATPSSRVRLLAQAYTSLEAISAGIIHLDNVELQYSILGDLILYALEWSSTVPCSGSSTTSLVNLLSIVDKNVVSSPNGSAREKSRVLCLAAQLARQISFWTLDDQVQTELTGKAVRLARLSKQMNDGTDPFLTAAIDLLLGLVLVDFESNPDIEDSLWRGALEVGRKFGDRYLIAWSSSLLSYSMEWKLSEAEEPGHAERLAEDCFLFGDEAVRNGSIIRFHHAIASTQAGPVSGSYYLLALQAAERTKRQELREKAVKGARLALESAKASGCLLDISNSFHSLSRSVEASCVEESDKSRRRAILAEALALRKLAINNQRLALPSDKWGHGVQLHYLATLLSELAVFENGRPRERLLSRALKASSMCVESCSATTEGSEEREKYGAHLARYWETHASLLEQFNSETGKQIFLDGALVAYRKAAQIYSGRRLLSHAASTLWRAGNIYHLLGMHEDSSREFGRSAEYYSMLEKEIPHLSQHFHVLASYMRAWSEVEGAHEAHLKGEYAAASERYRKASILLQNSHRDYLSASFLAWASIEHAEELSRKENIAESFEAFQEAASLFEKCESEASGRLAGLEDTEERLMAKRIATFSESHVSYCRARAMLDHGLLEEAKGDYVSASRLHERASDLFQSTLSRDPIDERADVLFALDLSKGWSVLCAARADSDPREYLRAAKLFKAAAGKSPNVRSGQYAMGNRFLSEALASETRFAVSADPKLYRTAKRCLKNASTCYSRANMDRSSLIVDARLSLLDASLYSTRAEASPDPRRRMRNLSLAERCLRHSLQLYKRAGDRWNQQEVEKILGKVSERKRLGRLLRETLERPVVASHASLISGPAYGPESAIGITQVEQRIVQAQLDLPDDVSDDEPFTVNLALVNVGNAPVSLLQLADLLPIQVKVVKVNSGHLVRDSIVDFAGKRLQPKAIESISVSCLSTPGLLEFKPRIVYLDGQGKPETHQLAALARYSLSHATFEFETPNSGAVFHFLASEFVRDYMVGHLASGDSGWRSFPMIVRKTKLPRSTVYSPRGLGTPLAELVRRGLVEVRIFVSQPGRGGRVQRARVSYDKNPVRIFIDRLAMKTGVTQSRTL